MYVGLMLFSTISDFFHGIWIEQATSRRKSRVFLISSVIINLGLLGFFKYSGLNLPLPIGISFYTFQTMSYTIDVYRKEVKAQRNILNFGVFVTMFPQLIAGPIVKYKDIKKELKTRVITQTLMVPGVERFIIGLGKKVLLANGIGQLFTETTSYETLPTMTAYIGILAYAFQIYFDFSGYTDMAIGLGLCLGFHFPENFNYPYISKSITEFWRRWHMSLGSWFREYVYIPLGGNQHGLGRQMFNILVVWSLTGIWHGAGVNFLLWGMWFALFLVIEKLFLYKILQKIPVFLSWFYAMFVVLIGWCFFSLEKKEIIIRFLKSMVFCGKAGLYNQQSLYLVTNYYRLFFILCFAATPIAAILIKKWRGRIKSKAGRILFSTCETGYLLLIFFLSIANIVDASYNPFLYFRF